ncbi:MAG TPA: hypothetical protein DCR46_07995 [Cytophagales bacterium]|jgi:hypothetical protein|nr:hypothetical protein [Cytophagales bacterium]
MIFTGHFPNFSKWAFEALDFTILTKSLRAEGFDQESIEAQMQALKKVRHAKRESRGFCT